MSSKLYYIVESKFWRRKIGNKLNNLINGVDLSDAYVNTSKEFHDSSPIKARKAAFNHYQSIVEVLYEGLRKKYTNDCQARNDLQYFMNSDNDIELGDETKFKITDDFLNGIEVYMIVETPLNGKVLKANGKYCIHGIRYADDIGRLDNDLIEYLENLFIENKYYEEYNYPTEKELVLKHFDPIGGNAEFYLQTPFDWDALMLKFDGQVLMKNGSL
ncbi:hypothetical protein [Carboxylicivirga sp. M1479]|uniref:hypothetical protein n=1 Tax=Carboxylicivirga sp. M1479 TaxID=2594476 RepID=UPI001177A3E5|nr:hypothetical protein [Carboxylicivirga sp. M1479]TRX65909.1 hypothetical protein FNN09_16080 [Carboxylicivirga sp. M1479]